VSNERQGFIPRRTNLLHTACMLRITQVLYLPRPLLRRCQQTTHYGFGLGGYERREAVSPRASTSTNIKLGTSAPSSFLGHNGDGTKHSHSLYGYPLNPTETSP
jgi:hypothetical protein